MLPAPGEHLLEEAIEALNALICTSAIRSGIRTGRGTPWSRARSLIMKGAAVRGPATSGWASTSRAVAARRPSSPPEGQFRPFVPWARLSFFTASRIFCALQ